LFEHCLNKLSGYIPGPDNLYSNYAHCETVSEFVHYLVEICSKDENKDDEVIGRYLVNLNFLYLKIILYIYYYNKYLNN